MQPRLSDKDSLSTAYVFGPSGQEGSENKEWGAGGFHERYMLDNRMAVGVQGLFGASNAMDRSKIGLYTRYGITQSLGVLAEANYTRINLSNSSLTSDSDIDQWTTYTRFYYFAKEWLIPSVTLEYAYLSNYADPHFMKANVSLDARINRNISVGVDYSFGDISSTLEQGDLFALKISLKP